MNDLESRDQIIENLTSRLEAAEAEVERLKSHTWKQEREAAVSWLTETAAIYVGVRDVEVTHVVSALAKSMAGGLHWVTERGDHWPEEGKS